MNCLLYVLIYTVNIKASSDWYILANTSLVMLTLSCTRNGLDKKARVAPEMGGWVT